MLLLHGVFLFVALAGYEAVKVNMMGSLSLGQEVMDVLAEYVKNNLVVRSARRMNDEPPDVPTMVRNAHLCRDIPFCAGTYEKNINDYIVTLYKAISAVFEGTLKDEVFDLNSKRCLRDVKKILKRADSKVSEDNEVHGWTSVLKKISAAFLERATEYIGDRVDPNLDKKDAVVRVLIQQLVVAIAKVEMDYQVMFCTEHSICAKKMECTRALHEVLGPMERLEDYKVRAFINSLRGNLAHSAVMLRLDDKIRKEFERVLDDMAHADKSPAKMILATVRRSIEHRLAGTERKGNDVLLMNTVLSDMDHVYDMSKRPFEHFLSNYREWVRTGDHLESNMKQLFSELTARLSEHSSGFAFKLFNEVQVFLELTIGSAVTR